VAARPLRLTIVSLVAAAGAAGFPRSARALPVQSRRGAGTQVEVVLP
jgi:hypothetical protein